MNSDSALDVLVPHLCVINLKNAYWRRVSGPEAEVAEWKITGHRARRVGRLGRK